MNQTFVAGPFVLPPTMARRLANVQQWGQETVAKAEAAQGQTIINQKVVTIPAETVVVAAETAAAVAVTAAAAMVTATMVAATSVAIQQPWKW